MLLRHPWVRGRFGQTWVEIEKNEEMVKIPRVTCNLTGGEFWRFGVSASGTRNAARRRAARGMCCGGGGVLVCCYCVTLGCAEGSGKLGSKSKNLKKSSKFLR